MRPEEWGWYPKLNTNNICCLLTVSPCVSSRSQLLLSALYCSLFVCHSLGEGKEKWWFSLSRSDWPSRTTLPICQTYRKYRPVKKPPLTRGICQNVCVCACIERCIIYLTNPLQAVEHLPESTALWVIPIIAWICPRLRGQQLQTQRCVAFSLSLSFKL